MRFAARVLRAAGPAPLGYVESAVMLNTELQRGMRLPQVLGWLQANPVDALVLQETKLSDDKFPAAEIEALINQELGEPFRRDAMKKPVEVAGISKADMRPQVV